MRKLITEAPVNPGEVKKISFDFERSTKLLKKLKTYEANLKSMKAMDLPETTKHDLENLSEKISAEIEKLREVQAGLSVDKDIKINGFFNGLMKNCKQILSVYKHLNQGSSVKDEGLWFLYRGITKSSDALYGKPFEYRKPKDSSAVSSEVFNSAMKAAGFLARRDNSIFVTGSKEQASSYGNLYIIFPVDGFDFTWSKKHRDLILSDSAGSSTGIIDQAVSRKLKNQLKMLDSTVISKLKSIYGVYVNDWNNSSVLDYIPVLKKAIRDEVLSSDFLPLIEELFKPDKIKKIIEKYDLSSTDLNDAITSTHEIYVSGPYYALEYTNANCKLLLEFLKSADALTTDTAHEKSGQISEKRHSGEVVEITDGKYKGKLATVEQWKGKTTEVMFNPEQYNILPTDWLRVVDPNYKHYLPTGAMAFLPKHNAIGIVDNSMKSTALFSVMCGLAYSRQYRVCKSEVVEIDTSQFKFSVGDQVIFISPLSMNGQMGIVTKLKNKKIVVSPVTPKGNPTGNPTEIEKDCIIPASNEFAKLAFPKQIAAFATLKSAIPTKRNLSTIEQAVMKNLESKIKQNNVTYSDIEAALKTQLQTVTDTEINAIVDLLKSQLVNVTPF